MRLHDHGTRLAPYLYAACMITVPPVICFIFFLVFHSHHIRLHSHGTQLVPHLYAVCMLTAPLFTCFIFFHGHHVRLRAHSTHPAADVYTACMLIAPLITCFIFCCFYSHYMSLYSHGTRLTPHVYVTYIFISPFVICLPFFSQPPCAPAYSQYSIPTKFIYIPHSHGVTCNFFTFFHSHHMRLYAHGIHPPSHLYAACMLTTPPVTCLPFISSTSTIYAYMLTVFGRHHTYMQPT